MAIKLKQRMAYSVKPRQNYQCGFIERGFPVTWGARAPSRAVFGAPACVAVAPATIARRRPAEHIHKLTRSLDRPPALKCCCAASKMNDDERGWEAEISSKRLKDAQRGMPFSHRSLQTAECARPRAQQRWHGRAGGRFFRGLEICHWPRPRTGALRDPFWIVRPTL